MLTQITFAEIDELMDNPPSKQRCSCPGEKYVVLAVRDCGLSDSFYKTQRCLECKKAFIEWIEG